MSKLVNININTIGGYYRGGQGSSYSAEYQAVLNSGIGTPPASEAGKQADDLLIQKAKAIGLWDASPCFFNHMTEGDADYACIDYKNPGVRTAELINAPTYTAKQGFTGNATSSYINWNFSPGDDGAPLFVSGDNGIAVWIGNDIAGNGVVDFSGLKTGEGGFEFTSRRTNDKSRLRMQDNTDSDTSGSVINSSTGLYILRRSAGNKSVFKDGIINESIAVALVTPMLNIDINGLCRNVDGTRSFFSNRQLGCFITFKQSLVSNEDIEEMWDEHVARIALL